MKSAVARAAALAAASMTGCTSQKAPVGGVMVVMSADGTIAPAGPYLLHVDVRAPAGGGPYYDHTFDVPRAAALPTTLAIASNGDPTAAFVLDVSLASPDGGTPIDTRSYEVDNVPTDRVVELDIQFSRDCSPHAQPDGGSDCPSGESCSPGWGGQCRPSVIEDGSQLPDAGADAGPFGGRGPSTPDAGALTDGADATLGDGASDTDEEGSGESGVACSPGTSRCLGQTTQSCAPSGQWQDGDACDTTNTHCVDGRCLPKPPSCRVTAVNARFNSGVDFGCGRADGGGDCCGTQALPSGTFDRTYDAGVSADPAAITGLYVDTFEVTVGRFRNFVNAVVTTSWQPDAGAGEHTHVNGGRGLASVSDGGPGYETGWDPAWNPQVTSTQVDWNTNLFCDVGYATWTSSSDTNEKLPVNCVNWYEAYAFCIWDGGFLPSEAEWGYAAAGGGEQRSYPWGSAPPSGDLAVYGCRYMGTDAGNCGGTTNIASVGLSSGVAKWGQLDLAGNLAEWTLDWYAPYVTPCSDCAALSGELRRVHRGGAFDSNAQALGGSPRASEYPNFRLRNVGFRCARTP